MAVSLHRRCTPLCFTRICRWQPWFSSSRQTGLEHGVSILTIIVLVALFTTLQAAAESLLKVLGNGYLIFHRTIEAKLLVSFKLSLNTTFSANCGVPIESKRHFSTRMGSKKDLPMRTLITYTLARYIRPK